MLRADLALAALWTSLSLAALGCGDGGGGTADSGTGGVRDTGVRAADAGVPPSDAGPPRDGGPRPDASAPPSDAGMPDGGMPPDTSVRFVVMGDTGEGNTAQREVAVAIRDLCAREGCDFVLLLGDNFYESGVESVTDPQWTTKFEEPYRDIELPFYPVLGNHDYGGNLFGIRQGGLGNEFDRGPIEVAYSAHSTRWEMPATHYAMRIGDVGIIALDTNSILWGNIENGDQRAWYAEALREVEGARWVILAGHHPYLSNGRHGNAGSYESIEVGGVELPNPLPILNGASVRNFFDDLVCGTVDIYFAGHDHNRQMIDEPDALCGAHIVVSGAGAKTTGFESSANRTLFADDTTEGFVYVVVEGDNMTLRFVDSTGRMEFEQLVAPRRAP